MVFQTNFVKKSQKASTLLEDIEWINIWWDCKNEFFYNIDNIILGMHVDNTKKCQLNGKGGHEFLKNKFVSSAHRREKIIGTKFNWYYLYCCKKHVFFFNWITGEKKWRNSTTSSC